MTENLPNAPEVGGENRPWWRTPVAGSAVKTADISADTTHYVATEQEDMQSAEVRFP